MRWLQLVAPAGAIIVLGVVALIAGSSSAFAADNLVRIEPAGVEVAPGGSFHVGVIDDPSPASTSIWAIDVVYDPAVVSTTDDDCKSIGTPPGAVGAFICQVVDADKDGAQETVKVLGVVLYSGTQTGLTEESKLADITFHTKGDAGACTELHMRIRSHADKDGHETGALVQDGRACIKGGAPPSGTASANPVTPRTSEPTEIATQPGSSSAATPAGSQQGGSPGGTGPTGAQASGSGSTSRTSGSATPLTGGSGANEDDGGGTSALVWVILGGVVLLLAGAGAWTLVRLRSVKPPIDPPPGEPPSDAPA